MENEMGGGRECGTSWESRNACRDLMGKPEKREHF